jgi:hypothetical protein
VDPLVDISGRTGLEWSAALASAHTPDSGDYIRFFAIVDGGDPELFFELTAPSANSYWIVNGVNEDVFTSAAAPFSSPIAAEGSLLTLRLVMSLSGTNAGADDIAMDDLMITGIPCTSP